MTAARAWGKPAVRNKTAGKKDANRKNDFGRSKTFDFIFNFLPRCGQRCYFVNRIAEYRPALTKYLISVTMTSRNSQPAKIDTSLADFGLVGQHRRVLTDFKCQVSTIGSVFSTSGSL